MVDDLYTTFKIIAEHTIYFIQGFFGRKVSQLISTNKEN
jgi:hypothetical protein